MPDRIYSLAPSRSIAYDVAFKRKPEDLHAVRSQDPAVFTCSVVVTMLDPKSLRVTVEGAGPRTVEFGDTVLAVYEAVRESVGEIGAPGDLGDCALIFTAKG